MTDAKKGKSVGDILIALATVCNNPACDKQPEENEKFKSCSRCHAAWYCSKECQTAHWKAHKPICDNFVEGGGPGRKMMKQYRAAATLITNVCEPGVFAFVRKQLTNSLDLLNADMDFGSYLRQFYNDFVVDINCDHVTTSMKDIYKYVDAVFSVPLRYSLTKISSLDPEMQKLLAGKSKDVLYVRIIKGNSCEYCPIHEGMRAKLQKLMKEGKEAMSA